MKKTLYLLIITLLLVGCTSTISQTERAVVESYESYYNLVLNEEATNNETERYTLSASLVMLNDNEYRYDLFIEDPVIAMRDVIVMVVEDDLSFEDQNQMMPTIGIYDNPVQLYPNQSDPELGFYKGINLNRVIEKDDVKLKVLIEYTNQARDINYEDVIEIELVADE